ncbi:SGNH/GDSL hydrolase family protein [Caldimonas thermodepolymerans]|uniref:Lipase n=1 Tax=Caldimonas thermodepolymerans TaxID=215580 RepID=A0A2S5T4R2_9BURK|nr:SGNH/GDSL hydrolase family protein [Caldimonas thermodepolymerans]PPE69936.1 lipase [Caldimonas thermodepolymerans]QPC31668.1 SGNH/GDSL hydrolase family protein [Caldimonas thermodepolymerans]RDH94864.1 lysophospholipase L1-like esterase [Caldimonas thermodepolymerans]
MRPRHAFLLCGLAACAWLAGVASSVRAEAMPPAWQTTWIAPPQPVWDERFVLPPGMPSQLRDVTLRQTLRTSLGGDRVRLAISNAYGRSPLRVGRMTIRRPGHAEAVPVRFGGADGTLLPPRAQRLSDPVALPVRAGERLEVDLYLPGVAAPAGFHWDAREPAWLLPGDATGRPTPADAPPLSARAFVTALQVQAARPPVAVVAIGDSLTDGNGATPGADQRWPDHLSRRLAPLGVAVLNAGISGNRLLRDGMGERALARFGRDALDHPGVRAVVVLLGTNDIGWPGGPFAPGEALPTLDHLADGLRRLAAQARARGVRVVGATLPPFKDALQGTPLEGHYSVAKDALRQALNAWIRTTSAFDAVVDFDAVLRDPADPARLHPAYDSGDHLHPGDTGYRAMAEAIDLATLLGAAVEDQR